MFGDAGYQGIEKRPENQGKTVEWLVAMKRSVRKALPADALGRLQERFEKLKASIR
ncbi:MAG: IS5/IS1182 family transposase, partial [Proteobacteria bacterium]|nr:IS5/IS1182 family transposase [Pseudomonadota bacterium]